MNPVRTDLLPVILGADLNCYNVARAFHEAYGVVSYAFGRYAIGSTMYSKIVRFTAVSDLDNEEVMLKTLTDFAASHEGKKRILFGCTDDYVNLIMKNRDVLAPLYAIPYPDYTLAEEITKKDRFYEICEQYDLPYPKTVVCTKASPSLPEPMPFAFPVIVKPSSSSQYWKFPFEGMKKVYRAQSRAEAQAIIDRIFASGYSESVVVQDTIPGDDSHMYVLTAYCGDDKKVRSMCLGHVLLEEHTPKGLGNHAAIVTESVPLLYERFKSFLEAIGYRGFANFDIKFDSRDNSYRVFEINTRQGRSNYYLTAAGQNLAELAVSDLIDKQASEGTLYGENEVYWRYIPDSVVNTYVNNPALLAKVKALKKAKKAFSLRYAYDLRLNPKRIAYTLIHEWRHIKKFNQYLGKKAD